MCYYKMSEFMSLYSTGKKTTQSIPTNIAKTKILKINPIFGKKNPK